MLIKALCDYYDILAAAGKVLPEGYSSIGIHYLIALTPSGELDEIIDWQTTETKVLKNGKTKEEKIPRMVYMPKRTEKTTIDANIVEHRPLYLFGLNYAVDCLHADDDTNKARESHKACLKKNLDFIEGIDSPIVNAYRNFLQNWTPEAEIHNKKLLSLGKKYQASYFAICLSGQPDILLHEDALVKSKWEQKAKLSESNEICMQCAVTGDYSPIARVHGKIKGINGGNKSGTSLISFNTKSAESYGNKQSYNSNVSETAMQKYTEALNYLLQGRGHKILMDDLTILFWAMNPDESCEDMFLAMLNGTSEKMDAEATTQMLKDLMRRSKDGIIYEEQLKSLDDIDPEVIFYMIGIKPNNTRLSIKFIDRKRYSDVLWNILRFQKEMQVSENFEVVSLCRINQELVSPKSKSKTCNPALISSLFKAIVYGDKYPIALLETVVRRVKTDSDTEDSRFIQLNKTRAGLIKAVLNRMSEKEELKVALDKNNFNQAYLCGRLFAVLEKIQEDASESKLNSTIKDRFFASAASKPVLVFPKLLKLTQNHLGKIKSKNEGLYVIHNKRIGEIMNMLQDGFPDTLLLADQGRFIIGYYQQRQSFFEKNKEEVEQ